MECIFKVQVVDLKVYACVFVCADQVKLNEVWKKYGDWLEVEVFVSLMTGIPFSLPPHLMDVKTMEF